MKRKVAIGLMLGMISILINGQIIPDEAKKSVAFFFVYDKIHGFVPYGTGFFVAINYPKESLNFCYLVTSKHILQDQNKNYLDSIYLRINKKDGKSDTILFELFNDKKPIFYVHKDQTVDIAVIPFTDIRNKYDIVYIGKELILTEEIYNTKKIKEGDEAFFTGLFTRHFGMEKNIPIVRFGRVALISKEKVLFDNQLMDLYLIETTSFGGNSGSPLFFRLGTRRLDNRIIVENYEYYLGGIIQGYFGEFTKPGYINVPSGRVLWPIENSGIAAVVPANKLYEILYSDELIQKRNKFILKK
ncbi:MAG: trypsin-like peptidase domain-containing protein [Bacteroidales bacterium]|nr:trypsin-like peptidase domain-containing protein [Bacteroidales bacterium]